jgi:hypothetical protein
LLDADERPIQAAEAFGMGAAQVTYDTLICTRKDCPQYFVLLLRRVVVVEVGGVGVGVVGVVVVGGVVAGVVGRLVEAPAVVVAGSSR